MTEPTPTPRALRKLRRRAENDVYAKEIPFWSNPKTALRMGYDKPINRQAVKELRPARPKSGQKPKHKI
jgi:hypothetical protein